jgi:hypothetical protein
VCERVGGPGQGLRGGLRKLEFSGTAKLPPSDLPFCPPCFMGASSYSRVISIPVEFGVVESYSELLSSLINGSIYIVFIGSTTKECTVNLMSLLSLAWSNAHSLVVVALVRITLLARHYLLPYTNDCTLRHFIVLYVRESPYTHINAGIPNITLQGVSILAHGCQFFPFLDLLNITKVFLVKSPAHATRPDQAFHAPPCSGRSVS